jgi:hypothetical protein
MKKLKKILKYVLIVVVILVIVIIFPIFSYKKETNNNPLPRYYKKGGYHMHSIYSDGKDTVENITKTAVSQNLNFLILTDHGRPNRECAVSTAYLNDVLLIGGSEFSLHSGHLAAMGFHVPDYILPPEPQEAINEVNHDNGVSFISHPFDDRIPWTDWDIKGFTGLEVLSCYSSARKVSFFKLVAFPLQYLLNSNYALVSTLKYPTENIKKWDSLNAAALETGERYYGIYALDAHGKLPISENFQLNFPSYQAMFEILTVYVKVDNKAGKDVHTTADTAAHRDAAAIISALKKGNFFNAVEAIAPANGFEAYFIDKTDRRFEMGSGSETAEGKLVIRLPFEFETTIVVKRNGEMFQQISNNREKELQIDIKEPGVYVIEVYVSENKFNKLPWILTNPFFVGVKEGLSPTPSTPEESKEIALKQPLGEDKGFFKVEKSKRSEGAISYGTSEEEASVSSFVYKLEKDSAAVKDFWSALAARQAFDFSGSTGIVFEARADKRRRFWVEFRTGKPGKETWYRHSFLLDVEWKRFHIPFTKFHVIFGENKSPDLSDVRSVFFSINNANAFPGTEGSIDLKNIGVY